MKKKSVNLIAIGDFDTLLSRKDCFYITGLRLSLFKNNKKINPLIEYMGNNISKKEDIMEGKGRRGCQKSLHYTRRY